MPKNSPQRLGIWLAACTCAAAVHAQDPVTIEPLEAPLTPRKETMLERDYMLGDPGGVRAAMLDRGISLDLQYVNDFFGVLGGEVSNGRAKDFGRVRLTVAIDFEQLIGIPGLTFRTSAINQAGSNIGTTIGSYANPSSIAGEETTRLDSFWLEQSLFNGVVVIRAGQMAQQDDYGVQEYGASYLLEPLGYAFGNLFGNVNATFNPASKPGVELRIYPYKGFYVKSMFQGGDPDPYGNDRYGLDFSLEGPGVLAAEIGYRTEGSPALELPTATMASDAKSFKEPVRVDGIKTLFDGLPAVYKVGGYANFGNFTDPRTGGIVRGNYLLYGMINQGIFREGFYGAAAERGLDAFIGADFSPYDVTFAYFQLTGGLRYTGLIPGRDKDTTAFGLVFTDFSNRFDTPTTRYTSETALEINYRAQLTPWLYVQPTAQTFVNPGGQAREMSFLLGIRGSVVF